MLKGSVLVCGEIREGHPDDKTLELLGVGKNLADKLGIDLSVALLGEDLKEKADELASFNVTRVYTLEDPLLGRFDPDLWCQALNGLCKQIEPKIILMIHSYTWVEVGAKLAFRLKVPLTTDCIKLDIDEKDGLLLRTKPVYGGNIIGVFKYREEPHLVTIRKNVMTPAERVPVKGDIIDLDSALDETLKKVESLSMVKEETVALDKAKVIISGGRGIGSPEGFKELEDLAHSMKKSFDEVMIACSRPVVDAGWMPPARQVGISSAIVQPDLYIAVGISGAIHHLGGMARAKKIVAINTNAASNIFHAADYGVVEDYKKFIPALKKKWEELVCTG